MPMSMSSELQRYTRNCHILKQILIDTQNALDDISVSLQLGEEIKNEFFDEDIKNVQTAVESFPVVLVYGQSCHAKAVFLNGLLNEPILPLYSSKWRWVKLSYGHIKTIHLTLGGEYEIVESLKAHQEPWNTLPEADLQRSIHECPLDHCPSLEVTICHQLLKQNLQIFIPPDSLPEQIPQVLKQNIHNILPAIVVYAITEETFHDTNLEEIRKLSEVFKHSPILFVSLSNSDDGFTESEKHFEESKTFSNLQTLKDQLIRLGYLNESICVSTSNRYYSKYPMENHLIGDEKLKEEFVCFVHNVLQEYLLSMSSILSEKHNKCLRRFIFSAFDMAREIQITPRRIHYAQEVELKLYNTLMKIACDKQEEICKIIQTTLNDMKSNVAEVLEEYHDSELSTLNTMQKSSVKVTTLIIQQIILKKLCNSVAQQLVQSVGCLQENFTGTLQRCLECLEKHCHNDIEGNLLASDAVKQIISAAYNVDLKSSSSSSFSVVYNLMDRLRQFVLHNFQLPWTTCTQTQCNLQWQLQIVTDMLNSLSCSRLAKAICTQFSEHVKSSHEGFQSAIRSLENQLSGQLEHTEEQRITIRKKHAPKFARLALESTSLCDLLRWGMPKSVREIGRGQYGVVYSCEPWADVNPCAIKSVVPPDDRHWNDLAMEFYYTRTIPDHPRIVRLRGSVIDFSYGGGSSPAVLLIMERMTRDLYCGLKSGLSWPKRIQIAIDVVEGIRYLHSQGLVHRDIKLKNVLLNDQDRAKLTDFGFCIPEAMMSGSIVGTPIHMAPELLSGRYDSSVDVYAFGILFWYICAGQVRLPNHFEQFHSKEQLWTSVRKGIRPECLANFDQACWNLMEMCWSAEPSQRPLLGYVQPQLQNIQARAALLVSSSSSTQDK